MKKLFKIMFFIMLALLLMLVVLIAVSAVSAVNVHTGSVGIIGGADGPTAILITKALAFESPLFQALCLVTALLAVSGIGWLITRKK